MENTETNQKASISSTIIPSNLQLNCCCAYLCNLCPRISFQSMELLDQHMKEEHQQNGNEKRIILKEENIESNQQIQSIPTFDPIVIDQNATTASSTNLSISPTSAFISPQQQQLNNNLADLTCKKCPGGKTFSTREHLELHNTNTHRDRPQQYCCNQCGAFFSVKRELATHLRIHSGEQPHQCEKCGKEFGTRQLLKKHNMWHTGERSHVCPSCGKAFFQKGHLTQHLMIHKGGRPHKCSLCSKTFIFKFDLNRHLKIHSDRSFVCSKCSKCFQQEIELKGHILNCKNSSGNIHRRNKRSSKRKECFLFTTQNNSTNNIGEDEITTTKKFKNDEVNNEHNMEFLKQNERNEQALNISIISSSSSPKDLKQSSINSPIICHQQQNLINNNNLLHQQPTHNNQNQLNLNRLTNLINLQKSNPTLFSAILMNSNNINNNIGGNGGINLNNNNEPNQLFSCLLCPQKFLNKNAYLYHWNIMHLRDYSYNNIKNEEIKIEENQQKIQVPSHQHSSTIFDAFNELSRQHPILQLLAADAYFSSSSTSPQKPSPVCSSTSSSLCSSSASSACSSASTSIDFPPPNSLISSENNFSSSSINLLNQQKQQINNNILFSSSFNCQNCLLEKSRLIEKEKELNETKNELERIRGLFLRFGLMLGIKNEALLLQQNNKNNNNASEEEKIKISIGNNQQQQQILNIIK